MEELLINDRGAAALVGGKYVLDHLHKDSPVREQGHALELAELQHKVMLLHSDSKGYFLQYPTQKSLYALLEQMIPTP